MAEPRISFREVTAEDVPLLALWTRDPEVTRFMENMRPMTVEDEYQWFKEMQHDSTEKIRAITVLPDHRLIGTCGMHFKEGGAIEIGIFIGDKREWGKGYGAEAMRMLAERAWKEGAKRVYLRVDTAHARAIRTYEKAGFRIVETRTCNASRSGGEQEHVMEPGSPNPGT